ncbi:MAG: hypothetical protein EZS28_018138 [Streblomastix strix]|uniref:Uncharacterized protein n=1 Tax=Streblomastix strix TaxID=222440 RepID=A0A5J4VV90_9EUKA|nr:MAG: hypothetical protein EZS28_018138 [Streblomastix strix]
MNASFEIRIKFIDFKVTRLYIISYGIRHILYRSSQKKGMNKAPNSDKYQLISGRLLKKHYIDVQVHEVHQRSKVFQFNEMGNLDKKPQIPEVNKVRDLIRKMKTSKAEEHERARIVKEKRDEEKMMLR